MKLRKLICAIVILVLLNACSLTHLIHKDINYDVIFDRDSFSIKNMEHSVEDNGKTLLLKLEGFTGVLDIAEANFDDSCDCSFLISEDVTDVAKIVLVNKNDEVIVLKEFTKNEVKKDNEEVKFVSYKGGNKIKIISENCIDVNLKLTQPDLIFKYNQGFPFSPLFGDEQLDLFTPSEKEEFLSI